MEELLYQLSNSNILFLVVVMNIASFIMFGADKFFSKNNMRRIPEKVLFSVAIFFGAPGAILAMQTFRHKTKHNSFKLGMPICLVINVVMLTLILA